MNNSVAYTEAKPSESPCETSSQIGVLLWTIFVPSFLYIRTHRMYKNGTFISGIKFREYKRSCATVPRFLHLPLLCIKVNWHRSSSPLSWTSLYTEIGTLLAPKD